MKLEALLSLIMLLLPGAAAMREATAERSLPGVNASYRANAGRAVVAGNFDLSDFGAVGDGVADDGPALQSALNALASAGGGTLFVPAGHYAIITPVQKNFAGLATSVTIFGVESSTPVPPPTSPGSVLTQGLDLVSEFIPKTGQSQNAITISGLETFLVKDIVFIGTPGVSNDALITLALNDISKATIRHCEFYGLSSLVDGGAILQAVRSELFFEQSVVLGSACNSAFYSSIVQNLEWKGITVSEAVFADYGQRPNFFGKMTTAPFSWVGIGNAAVPDNDSPRREASFTSVMLDEGGYVGLSSLPYRYSPPSAPIDLLYVTGLFMNVSNLGTTGHHLTNLEGLLVEKSHYGWSHNTNSAILMLNVGQAILDEIECVDDADTIYADAATEKLTVINSTYTTLNSSAPITNVITTATTDEDPVQHVRQQFLATLGRVPDPAGHFYWSDQILQCGADAQCVSGKRAALAAYLGAAPAPKFGISGHVIDETGANVAGVVVTLSGSQSVTTTTDSAGQYHVSNLPTSGVYTVTLTKDNHTLNADSRTIVTPAGDQVFNSTATLNRHSISGRIADSVNTALAGVTVTLTGSQAGTATTGADGNYSFPDLPAGGSYTVTPEKTSYTFAPASHVIPDLDADQTLNFTSTYVTYFIGGIVVGHNNNPIAGVTISLEGTQTGTITTAANGEFAFYNLPSEGDYTVTPTLTNYWFSPESRTFENLSANQSHAYQATFGTYTISGNIANTAGGSLAGAVVTLSGFRSRATTTDASGNYSFANLPSSGNYTVTPTKTHHTFAPPSQTLSNLGANQTVNFTGTLNRHNITGRATAPGGSGLAGVTMTLSGSQSGTATTDSNGNYSFANLPAGGNYTVTPSKTSYSWSPQTLTFNDLAANQTANFTGTFVSHTISGQVKENGAGLSGVSIALSGSQTSTATTDVNGNYSFTLPSEGNYTVTPAKQHYTFSPASRTYNNLAASQTADFVATRNRHTISGQVTNASNTALVGVTVTLSGSATGTTTTNSSGNYSFADLPAGSNYTVTPTKTHHTFAPPSQTLSNFGANQTVNFTGTLNRHNITGRATAPGGSGLAGVTMTLSGSQSGTATTDSNGNYSFTNLAAGGNYTVTPSKTSYSWSPQTLSFNDLAANQTANFTGTFVSHTISGQVKENGAGLSGVSIALSGSQTSTATTDVNGNYSFTLPSEGNYTVTPAKQHYTFSPASRTYNNLAASQIADFVATRNRHTISGQVTNASNTALVGVTVTLSGSATGTTTTNSSGNYSFADLPAGSNYTVTPTKTHHTFAPPSQTLSNFGANQTVNFTGTLNRHNITGRATAPGGSGLAGVTVTLSGSQSGTATTDSNGNYSFTNLAAGGNYTVTPSLQYYSFTPASQTFTNLAASQQASFSATLNTHTISGRVTDSAGSPLAGATVTLSGSAGPTSFTTAADGNYSFGALAAGGSYVVAVAKTNYAFAPASRSFSALNSNQTADFSASPQNLVEFSQTSYSVQEGAGTVTITITRTGDTSTAAKVSYAASNGTATQGKDLSPVIGKLVFNPAETSRSFIIFITDDAFVESTEQLTLILSYPEGALLGSRASAILTINDNDSGAAPNPIDEAQFFVRQHYRDFLNREPDAAGLAFWADQIIACGTNAACVEDRRINVSAAFFLSIEFQETGFLVHRVYQSSFGQPPRYLDQFLLDSRTLAEGLVVNAPGWQQKLEDNKVAYLNAFVQRPDFVNRYPSSLTPASFVNSLNTQAGAPLTADGIAAAVAEFNGAATSSDTAARARVLRRVVESELFIQRETNPAFVLMQYFGYLQRNPSDPPNTNLDGYNFWLQKLNDFGGDFRRAEMVRAFLVSDEYRHRFGL